MNLIGPLIAVCVLMATLVATPAFACSPAFEHSFTNLPTEEDGLAVSRDGTIYAQIFLRYDDLAEELRTIPISLDDADPNEPFNPYDFLTTGPLIALGPTSFGEYLEPSTEGETQAVWRPESPVLAGVHTIEGTWDSGTIRVDPSAELVFEMPTLQPGRVVKDSDEQFCCITWRPGPGESCLDEECGYNECQTCVKAFTNDHPALQAPAQPFLVDHVIRAEVVHGDHTSTQYFPSRVPVAVLGDPSETSAPICVTLHLDDKNGPVQSDEERCFEISEFPATDNPVIDNSEQLGCLGTGNDANSDNDDGGATDPTTEDPTSSTSEEGCSTTTGRNSPVLIILFGLGFTLFRRRHTNTSRTPGS